jgi:hypothetical protein
MLVGGARIQRGEGGRWERIKGWWESGEGGREEKKGPLGGNGHRRR